MPGLFALFLASAARPACAEGPYPDSDARDSTPSSELVRGQRARDAGRWTEAEAAYRAALAATESSLATDAQRAEIAGELGLCEIELRRYRDAAEHLAKSLRHRAAISPGLRRRFDEGRRRTEGHVARLYLGVSPPDAALLVDGRAVGPAAPTYELFLEPGQHTVRATLPGHVDALGTFNVVAGQAQTISLALPRAPEPSGGAPAPARAAAPELARAPARAAWYAEPRNVRIAGVALTTATAAAGAVFLIRSAAMNGDLHERDTGLRHEGWAPNACVQKAPPACIEVHDLRRGRDLFAELGTAAMITSGVLGAATVASYFVDLSFLSGRSTREGLHVVPVTTGHQAGLLIRGAW